MVNESRTRASLRDTIGYYRFRIGEFECAVISDGALEIQPAMWGGNAPEGELPSLMKNNGLDVDIWYSGLHCLLVDTGELLVLIDTGAGEFSMPGSEPNAGKLLPTLTAMGIEPDAIDHVIVTHYHPDHVGNISVDNRVAFPNATYWLSQAEADFLADYGEDPFAPFANQKLQPIRDNNQLKIFNAGDEIISGFKTLAAYGHTPGHIVLMIGQGDEILFHMVDVAPNPVVSLQYPEWHFMFDSNPEQGVTTRHEILGKAADENLLVMSYHFPFPAVGYIVRDDDSFKYTVSS
ncbi:MAG: MBL fold metallo-hydrolase [Chloroflexota bacterium]